MDEKYLKAIKDEIKGLIKHCSMYASAELQAFARAYQHALDIIQKYEKRDKYELEKAQKAESDS